MRSVSFCENLDTIKTFFVFNGRKPEEIVVRFSIDFFDFLISDYTKKEFQMLMTLIGMISYVKKNEGQYSINFSQFKRDGGFERLSKKEMEKMFLKIPKMKNGSVFLETAFKKDEEETKLEFKINPSAIHFFHDVENRFIAFNMKELDSFSSLYAKRFFIFLRKKEIGLNSLRISLKKLRKFLCVPKKYTNKDFMNKIYRKILISEVNMKYVMTAFVNYIGTEKNHELIKSFEFICDTKMEHTFLAKNVSENQKKELKKKKEKIERVTNHYITQKKSEELYNKFLEKKGDIEELDINISTNDKENEVKEKIVREDGIFYRLKTTSLPINYEADKVLVPLEATRSFVCAAETFLKYGSIPFELETSERYSDMTFEEFIAVIKNFNSGYKFHEEYVNTFGLKPGFYYELKNGTFNFDEVRERILHSAKNNKIFNINKPEYGFHFENKETFINSSKNFLYFDSPIE